jgi:hypothetical protein
MRFCANVSILFKEAPFVERFGRGLAGVRGAGEWGDQLPAYLWRFGGAWLRWLRGPGVQPTTWATEESFGWIPETLRGGEVRVEDLRL